MIGNPNEKEAKLRVDKGGEYVVRLTVTDEDKTSSTEVTVTMTGCRRRHPAREDRHHAGRRRPDAAERRGRCP